MGLSSAPVALPMDMVSALAADVLTSFSCLWASFSYLRNLQPLLEFYLNLARKSSMETAGKLWIFTVPRAASSTDILATEAGSGASTMVTKS